MSHSDIKAAWEALKRDGTDGTKVRHSPYPCTETYPGIDVCEAREDDQSEFSDLFVACIDNFVGPVPLL